VSQFDDKSLSREERELLRKQKRKAEKERDRGTRVACCECGATGVSLRLSIPESHIASEGGKITKKNRLLFNKKVYICNKCSGGKRI
jgi:hypothetical protein